MDKWRFYKNNKISNKYNKILKNIEFPGVFGKIALSVVYSFINADRFLSKESLSPKNIGLFMRDRQRKILNKQAVAIDDLKNLKKIKVCRILQRLKTK